MKKIITLFERNFETDRLVRNEVTPGAEWVLAGEGTPTQKFDGTCCMVKDGVLYKRYDVKNGWEVDPDGRLIQLAAPRGFIPAQEPDPITRHWSGWMAVSETAPEDRWHREAWEQERGRFGAPPPDGTYELCGPKLQGNPEGLSEHRLLPHGSVLLPDFPRHYDDIWAWFAAPVVSIEGVVFWRNLDGDDCDKVKIKARDFGFRRR